MNRSIKELLEDAIYHAGEAQYLLHGVGALGNTDTTQTRQYVNITFHRLLELKRLLEKEST